MSVTIQVSSAVAAALRRRSSADTAAAALQRLSDELGLRLAPIHPEAAGDDLARYFTIEIGEPHVAETLLARLRACPGVDAAYMKPSDAMP